MSDQSFQVVINIGPDTPQLVRDAAIALMQAQTDAQRPAGQPPTGFVTKDDLCKFLAKEGNSSPKSHATLIWSKAFIDAVQEGLQFEMVCTLCNSPTPQCACPYNGRATYISVSRESVRATMPRILNLGLRGLGKTGQQNLIRWSQQL